jgi:hypothetical protein
MWGKMKNWLLHGAIETDEKMAADLAGPAYHINRSNPMVLESKADMQKRGQASPDDGGALTLTFAQPVALAAANLGGCDFTTKRVRGQSVTAMVEVAWTVNGLNPDCHAYTTTRRRSPQACSTKEWATWCPARNGCRSRRYWKYPLISRIK